MRSYFSLKIVSFLAFSLAPGIELPNQTFILFCLVFCLFLILYFVLVSSG
ncbi:hypothetical protein OIU77_019742 [Salix suchowensis]|uniref:Photosystem II protein I n=1 Tax=Salix suchowensis TaxID=1278906 RepID=A0ABQ9CLB7_9ROSI|nr:hypothetical protein OIU77_019742 [Salix suchowensis]